VRGEIAGRDRDRLGEQDDRLGAIALPRQARRTVAECQDRGGDVLERDRGPRQPAERLGVPVLLHELPVCLLGLTELAVRKELRGGVEGEARGAAVLRLRVRRRVGRGSRGGSERRGTESGDAISEFGRALLIHDPCRRDPRALRERRQMPRRDRVGGAFQGAKLFGKELRRGRPEVLLRDLQDLVREPVHSSPGSSANA